MTENTKKPGSHRNQYHKLNINLMFHNKMTASTRRYYKIYRAFQTKISFCLLPNVHESTSRVQVKAFYYSPSLQIKAISYKKLQPQPP